MDHQASFNATSAHTMNFSQAQYIITDVPLQGKVKTYWFQLDFTVLIPACAQGQIIRKLHIIWICSRVSEK